MKDRLNEVYERLDEDAAQNLKKLKKRDVFKVGRIAQRIMNNLCPVCKAEVLSDPNSKRNIEDFCEVCQKNKTLLALFKKLENINKRYE